MTQEIKVPKKVVWVVPNMSKKSTEGYENETLMESRSFSLGLGSNITEWSLDFYPNGEDAESKGHIGLFLNLKACGSTVFNVKYSLGIKGVAEKDTFMKQMNDKQGSEFIGASVSWGYPKLMSFTELFDPANKYIADDKITLICDMTISAAMDSFPICDKTPSQSVASDVVKMYEAELFTDFELKCSDGKVLKAHKFILAARSPVFHAMLTNDMKEAKEGIADVPNFDSKVMKEVLRFIYCSKVDGLKEMSPTLIFAAEKYELEELEEMCIDSMIGSLTVENVLESLVIANRVSEEEKLFEKCADLIINNYEKIQELKEWKQLPKEIMLKIIGRLINSNSSDVLYI